MPTFLYSIYTSDGERLDIEMSTEQWGSMYDRSYPVFMANNADRADTLADWAEETVAHNECLAPTGSYVREDDE